MKAFRKDVEVGYTEEFCIICVSDIHFLKSNHIPEYVNTVIKEVKKHPGCIVFELGDICDYIATSDPRFSASSLPDEILTGTPKEIKARLGDIYKYSTEQICKKLQPIKDNIFASVIGNHEAKVGQYHHLNVQKLKCELLECHNGGTSAIINIVAKRTKSSEQKTIRVLIKHHPVGGGRTLGAPYNSMEKLANLHDVDIVAAGHIHVPVHNLLQKTTTGSGKNPKIINKDLLLINTGSATMNRKQDTDTYEEFGNYRTNPIFVYKIFVRPFNPTKVPRIRVEEVRVLCTD